MVGLAAGATQLISDVSGHRYAADILLQQFASAEARS
jgi:hypothetical protein